MTAASLNPYFNREKSILAFQERVLYQAQDPSIPLLERIRFLTIVTTNLDEFFEVRFANIKERIYSGITHLDGEPVDAWSEAIQTRVGRIFEKQTALYENELLPLLKSEASVEILPENRWSESDRAFLLDYFKSIVKPVLTPIALDVAHPFPHISNKTLNLIIELDGVDAYGRKIETAILPIPKNLHRIVELPESGEMRRFVFVSDIITAFIAEIFKGVQVKACYQFRLTRNSHLFIDEEELTNLHQTLKGELHQRNFGHGVRLEVTHECPPALMDFLLTQFDLKPVDLYVVPGLINFARLSALLPYLEEKHALFYEPFTPKVPKKWANTDDYFGLIWKNDIYLHHPFDSFTPVIDLLRAAADDPDVQIIRMTVYRTGNDSVLMEELIRAAQNGKEVNVIFELMARFDEATNLAWASILEEAGVRVVYGVFGFKTHAKMLLIVRRETSKHTGEPELRFYTHISTGNYHSNTAKHYTDMALLTSDEAIAKDVSDIFLSLGSLGSSPKLRTLWQSPFNLFDELIEKIDGEIAAAKRGEKAYIVGKMNALLEERMIDKLYEASQTGVKIELIVRGACSLKPGIKGVSDNITVRSIIGRFLEHSRLYYFYNGGAEDLYLASADWMNRNFFRRIEVGVPIQDNEIKKRIIKEGLKMYLNDNMGAWYLDEFGDYHRVERGEAEPFSAQQALLESRS